MSPAERRHCVVTGRVQGVGYRAFVVSVAQDLGLNGWVRNNEDGQSVELVAEGLAADLDRLVERLRVGPAGSRVESVRCEARPTTGTAVGFEVRR